VSGQTQRSNSASVCHESKTPNNPSPLATRMHRSPACRYASRGSSGSAWRAINVAECCGFLFRATVVLHWANTVVAMRLAKAGDRAAGCFAGGGTDKARRYRHVDRRLLQRRGRGCGRVSEDVFDIDRQAGVLLRRDRRHLRTPASELRKTRVRHRLSVMSKLNDRGLRRTATQ